MGRERLEAASAWVVWARAELEAWGPQLVAAVVSHAVAPFGGSAAGWLGAALAIGAGHSLIGERLGGILAGLEEAERQIAVSLAEPSLVEIVGEAA